MKLYIILSIKRPHLNILPLTCAMVAFIPGQIGIPLILRLPEIGQYILVRPTGISKIRPLVKVSFISPDVEHCI